MNTPTPNKNNKKAGSAAFGVGMVAGTGVAAGAAKFAQEAYANHDEESDEITPLDDAEDEIDILDESEVAETEPAAEPAPVESHHSAPHHAAPHHSAEPAAKPEPAAEPVADVADAEDEIDILDEPEDEIQPLDEPEVAIESVEEEVELPTEPAESELAVVDEEDELPSGDIIAEDDVVEDNVEIAEVDVPIDGVPELDWTPDINETPEVAQSSVNLEFLGTETITLEDGSQSDLAYFQNDGHIGAIVDVDQDGQADILMYDANNNGEIEDDEFFDLREDDLMMASLDEEDTPMDLGGGDGFDSLAMNGDAGDYINDANVDDFFTA